MNEPRRATLPKPGDVLSGKYEIVRVIGEGGMGVVFEAMHLRLRQRVAIKMLQPSVLQAKEFTARFEREARAAAQLRSRHVARVLDVEESESGLPYMVLELLEGRDLAQELHARGTVPVAEAIDYVLQACSGMIEAHAHGVIHRDLKPSNLFLAVESDRTIIKVLDFGISKVQTENEARVTSTHSSIGTPLYMSPEQIRSSRAVDERTDIWSLGVILYELIAGRVPFEGMSAAAVGAAIVADPVPPLRHHSPGAPVAIEAILEKALAKDPTARFADVRAFALALQPFAAHAGSVARIGAAPPARSPSHVSVPAAGEIASPSLVSAPTMLAPSVSPPAPPRVIAGGATTAGWATASHRPTGAPRARTKTIVVALAIAVPVIAVGAFLALRGRDGAAAASSASPSAVATASLPASDSATATAAVVASASPSAHAPPPASAPTAATSASAPGAPTAGATAAPASTARLPSTSTTTTAATTAPTTKAATATAYAPPPPPPPATTNPQRL